MFKFALVFIFSILTFTAAFAQKNNTPQQDTTVITAGTQPSFGKRESDFNIQNGMPVRVQYSVPIGFNIP